ncbi:MAG: hypothetical protein K0Q73_1241 [Paenibacillus sp.]|nr:hypothetical protein [Paenibacillus sp.]
MKYDISQVQGSVATVWLYVYGRALESLDEDTPVAHSLYAVTEDNWTKDGMMWANKPILKEKLSTIGVRKGEDAWYRMDATMFVKEQLAGDKTVSLAIALDIAQAGFLSRFNGSEQDDHRPYLRIETYPPVELASISVKADKMQLLRNDTAQLQVTGKLNTSSTVLLDHADIVYESLTPDTATVTGTGLVTALDKGEAVIQVSATWNGVTKNARITLQVSNNLALISQISVDSTNGSNVKERVIDGNLSTRWVSLASLTGGEPHYLRLDWAVEQSINQLKLWSGHDPVTGSAGWHVRDFDLEYWDGSQWKTLSKVQDNQEDAFYQQATKLVFNTIKTTAIQLKFTKPSWGAGNPNDTTVRINEIAVSLEE